MSLSALRKFKMQSAYGGKCCMLPASSSSRCLLVCHSPRNDCCRVGSVQYRPSDLEARRAWVSWWIGVVKREQMAAKRATELNWRDKAAHMMIPLSFHWAAALNLLSSRPRTRKGVAGGDTCSELCDVALQATHTVHSSALKLSI